MSVTLDELNRFHGFAVEKIDAGENDWTLHDLLEQWEIQNPDPARLQADVLAVKAALKDLKSGDRGMPFDDHLGALAVQFGLESAP